MNWGRAWIAKRSSLIALILVFIASLRIVSTYRVLSHTFDEPVHLAAGLEWIDNGTYTYEDQHPPLARVAGALGAYSSGARWSHIPNKYEEGYHLLGRGATYVRRLFFSRLFMLPFFWFASAVVYVWARRIGGAATAVLATLLFTTTPPVLAHAGVAATDMALTAFCGGAFLASLYLIEKPGWLLSLFFGLVLALAVLSKFSALAFLPVAWFLAAAGYVWRAARLERSTVREALGSAARLIPWLAVSATTAAFLIWAAYRFEFRYFPSVHATLPAPAFFSGIKSVIGHNSFGHLSYLLGRRSMGGFWFYYPVSLAFKTPIATLILIAIAVGFVFRRPGSLGIATPLALIAGVLVVGMASRINIGVRHILPVYMGFAVCGGVVLERLLRSIRWWVTLPAAALVLWQIVTGAMVHPDYIAYTNEIAGGHPERFVADSDLDWIQGMGGLERRLNELHVQHLNFTCGFSGYGYARVNAASFPSWDFIQNGDQPKPGWNAVCITIWKLLDQPKWAVRIAPNETIRRSINLYYIPGEPRANPQGSADVPPQRRTSGP